MKKLLLLLFVASFAFVSCTDNTDELLKENTQSIDKGNNFTTDGGGVDTSDVDES